VYPLSPHVANTICHFDSDKLLDKEGGPFILYFGRVGGWFTDLCW